MSAPIRSMTGFARLHKATASGEVAITLKTVNHRGLDLHFHLDSEMDAFEASMRATLKRAVLRGHVDIRCSLNRPGNGNTTTLNEPLFRAYLLAFRKAAADSGLDSKLDLNQVFRIPGMFGGTADAEPDPAAEASVNSVLEETLKLLNQFREREGAELGNFIRAQNKIIGDGALELERIRAAAVPAFQARLSERLADLLRNAPLDPQRLAQEAALLADRSDVGEEIERLKIHSRQLNEIIENGGEVGKKLDFLLQEINRESNTILSKTNGIGEIGLKITDVALAAKGAVEKIREQALNLE